MNEDKMWLVYIKNESEYDIYNIGVITDLDIFKKIAKEKYGLENTKVIENEYGRGSLHYEYSVKRSERFSEYYNLVAEPINYLT